jgi:HAD superfamily hydrolase (TIGR01484 family)
MGDIIGSKEMEKINKKIIAFDMDGTLTESRQHLDPEMSGLLCRLALSGKKVVVISGGSFHQFQRQFLAFLKPENEDVVAVYRNLILLPTSGSQRYEFDEEKNEWILTDYEAFPEWLRKIVLDRLNKIISDSPFDIHAVIPNDEIIEDRKTQITFSALGQNAPLEQKKLWDADQAKRRVLKEEIEKDIPDVDIIIGGLTSLDILPKGFDKAKGLNRLLAKLNLTKTDMVFLGDAIFPGGNDYSVYEAGIESIKVSGPAETKEFVKGLIS